MLATAMASSLQGMSDGATSETPVREMRVLYNVRPAGTLPALGHLARGQGEASVIVMSSAKKVTPKLKPRSSVIVVHSPPSGSARLDLQQEDPSLLSNAQQLVHNNARVVYKSVLGRYRALPVETREQFLFVVSTLLGTALFIVLFECFLRVNAYSLEHEEAAFSVSYSSAYFISIFWQHALNRWLLQSLSATPYWVSLFQSYVVYTMSMVVVALLGGLLMALLTLPPRVVTAVMLPVSGVFNYFFLKVLVPDTS